MKKMMIALVAMFVMTMSANAQSANDKMLSFNRLASYLELTVKQVDPVKTAMAQFSTSMEALYQLEDDAKAGETWQKIEAQHKTKMKKLLSEKQYKKYVQILDTTVQNTADEMKDSNSQDVATK